MKKGALYLLLLFVLSASAAAVPMGAESQRIAGYLSMAALLVSLPAFISLYLHIRKTNLGKVLMQPFLAMFIGFFGIMLNSIIDIWRVFQGYTVDNIGVVMSINRAFSSVLIAVGCVLMFLALRKSGLFSYEYYHKNEAARDGPIAGSEESTRTVDVMQAKTSHRGTLSSGRNAAHRANRTRKQ
jgi:hypothetical protein